MQKKIDGKAFQVVLQRDKIAFEYGLNYSASTVLLRMASRSGITAKSFIKQKHRKSTLSQ
jgi:hypothetical protein